jgi:hypothetical protein
MKRLYFLILLATFGSVAHGEEFHPSAAPAPAPVSTAATAPDNPCSDGQDSACDPQGLEEVQVPNGPHEGAINAGIYKDGKLV